MMNQLVKTRQISDRRINATGSIKEIEIRHEPKPKWDVFDLLGITVVKVDQSRDIMSDIRNIDSHVMGFITQLCLMLVVQHGLMQRVNMRLYILVSKASTMRLIRFDMWTGQGFLDGTKSFFRQHHTLDRVGRCSRSMSASSASCSGTRWLESIPLRLLPRLAALAVHQLAHDGERPLLADNAAVAPF